MRSVHHGAAALSAASLLAFAGSAPAADWINGAGGLYTDPLNWSPMVVPDGPGGVATIALGGTYTVEIPFNTGISIDLLELLNPDATLFLRDATTLGLGPGAHTNNGLVLVNNDIAGGNNALVLIEGDASIGGDGVLALAEDLGDDAQLNTVGGVTLTNLAGHTIAGHGLVNAALVNEGLVTADVDERVLTLQSGGKTNTGVLSAANGGRLSIGPIEVDQTPEGGAGMIVVGDAGSLVTLDGNNTIVGGSFEGVGDALPVQRSFNGATTLEGVTLNHDFDVADAATLTITGGGLTNNGVLRVNNFIASGFNAIVNFPEAGVLTGAGLLRLADSFFDDAQLNGTLTQDALHTIAGTGVINAALANDGLVWADQAGLPLTLQDGIKVNNNVMGAIGGGRLVIGSIVVDQAGGGVLRADGPGSVIEFQTGASNTVIGGAIEQTAGGAPIERRFNGTTTLDNVTLDADLNVADAATISVTGGALTNNGVLRLNDFIAGGNDAILSFPGAGGLLTGVGEVRLADDAQDDARIDGVVTQDDSHAIRGAGVINATLTNDGEVWADLAGLPITLQGGNKENNSVIGAVDGGVLRISQITIDQTGGGVLTAEGDGSLIEFVSGTSGTITGGVIESVDGAPAVERRFNGTTTLDGVTLDADLNVADACTVNVVGGGLVNNGSIRLNNFVAGGNNAIIQFTSPNLGGNGEILLFDSNSEDAQVNGTFTQPAAHLIRGTGVINAALTNLGEVRADQLGLPITLQSQNKLNSAVMAAVDGGVLRISQITIDQTGGGVLSAEGDGSLIEFIANTSSTVVGGLIEAVDGAPAIERRFNGTTTLDGVTLDADLNVADAGTISVVGGGLVNNGSIRLNNFIAGGNNAIIQFTSPNLGGNGEILLFDSNSEDAQVNGTFTQPAAHVIRGTGVINAALTNLGEVLADQPGLPITLQGGNKVNNGLMAAVDGGRLRIGQIVIDQNTVAEGDADGVLLADAEGSAISFMTGTSQTVSGGEIGQANGADAVVREFNGALTLNGVVLNADLRLLDAATIIVNGPVFENNGLLTVNELIGGSNNSVLSFSEAVTLTGSGEIALRDPNSDDAQLNGSTITNGPDHTISGDGVVNATIVNQGEMAPGLPTGSLPVNGSYVQAPAGVLRVTLAGLSDFSQVAASLDSQVDGGVIVEVDPEFVPPVGSEYDIVTAPSVVGGMEVIEAPVIGRLIFGTITDPDRVRLIVSYCADLNDDDAIDSQDLNIILASFGQNDGGDINGDDLTDSQDLNLLLAVFGQLCD